MFVWGHFLCALFMYRNVNLFLFSPALTNVADGRQKLVVLQTFKDGLDSDLRGAEGGLRAGAFPGGDLIIRHGGCCYPQVALQLI